MAARSRHPSLAIALFSCRALESAQPIHTLADRNAILRLCLGPRTKDPAYLGCDRRPGRNNLREEGFALPFAFRGTSRRERHGALAAGMWGRGALGPGGSWSRETKPEPDCYHLQGSTQGLTLARWAAVSKVLQLPQTVPPAGGPSAQIHGPVEIAHPNHRASHIWTARTTVYLPLFYLVHSVPQLDQGKYLPFPLLVFLTLLLLPGSFCCLISFWFLSVSVLLAAPLPSSVSIYFLSLPSLKVSAPCLLS